MYFFMLSSSFCILREWVYDPHTSLQDHIELLSEPTHTVQDEEIANLIVKYFFSYLYEGAHLSKIPEEYINNVFKCVNQYFQICMAYSKVENPNPLFKTIHRLSYQLAMLWDVASTIPIVKDIIQRKINDTLGNKKYVWAMYEREVEFFSSPSIYKRDEIEWNIYITHE